MLGAERDLLVGREGDLDRAVQAFWLIGELLQRIGNFRNARLVIRAQERRAIRGDDL